MSPRRNMHLGAKPGIFKNAYVLRHKLTPAEEILWEHLKDRKLESVRFRRQQLISDTDRTEILNSYQVTILRFANEEIMNNLSEVLETIRTTTIRIKEKKK